MRISFDILFYWKEVMHVIMSPSYPSRTPHSKKKKKMDKGLPAKGLWIFFRHGWPNINRKFCRMSMPYLFFPHYDVSQYLSQKHTPPSKLYHLSFWRQLRNGVTLDQMTVEKINKLPQINLASQKSPNITIKANKNSFKQTLEAIQHNVSTWSVPWK